MSNDGDVVQLMELHKKVLKWACDVAFDKNTNYGKRNLFLYEKFSNPEETDSAIDKELEYIRKVNKNEIKNENDIFYNFDFLHPGKVLLKLMYSSDSDDIMKNSYILGLPATIILLSVFVILVVIAVLFYKYTKPIYARVKEVFVLVVYSIASIFDSSISPKYIITDLLINLREQIAKQAKKDNTLSAKDEAKEEAEGAKGAKEAKDEAEGAKDEAEGAKDEAGDEAEGAKGAKEEAKDEAEGAKDEAEGAKDGAEDVLGNKAKDVLGNKAKDVLGNKATEVLGDKATEVLGDKVMGKLGNMAKKFIKK